MRRFALAITFLLIGCSHASTPRSPADRIARIEQHLVAPDYAKPVPKDHASIPERMAYWHVPAVSVAVINDGRVEWAKAYGIADLGTGRAADAHTLFHAASLSKPVNAITVLKFVQDGKLDLDRPVNDQLKSWKLPESEFTRKTIISLRRLLSHTAGMSVATLGRGFSTTRPTTLVDFLNGRPPATQPVKVEEQPGKRFHYSGGAVAISQLMLEEAAAEPYPRIVKETVFDPLAMTESTFEEKLLPDWLARTAPGYDKTGKRVNGPERVYPAMSAAGLWSTPTDYCQIILEIQRAAAAKGGAKILSPGAVEVMLTPYIQNAKNASNRTSTVGLGLFLAGDSKHHSGTFFHAGSHAGYACYAVGRLEAGQGIVVMTNGEDAFDLIGEICQTIADEYGWPDYHFIPPPRSKAPTTTTTTAAAPVQ
jgi:CubicO group peptidase (beta-lactamase class C family)